jgi:PadR family transcriptional regulator PadR
MAIQVPTELLDGTVLAILSHENLYGYALTKKVQENLSVSESTVYPVLRRLKKNDALTTYDEPYEGRMRRYYKLTESGKLQLKEIRQSWSVFAATINEILGSDE